MLKGSIFMKYRRILLKLSGEVLSGKTPIDFDNVMTAAGHIKALHDGRVWLIPKKSVIEYVVGRCG